MSTITTNADTPVLSIIVPHRDDVPRLERCLQALLKAPSAGVEILVVDNGSTVSLEGIRQSYPAVRIIHEAEAGAGPARNRGVAESRGAILAFTDADCVPADDWLAVARQVAEDSEIVGGRVDVFDETPPPRSGAEAFETVFAFDARRYFARKGFLMSGNLVVRRAAFEAVGGFGNGLSEDVDWSRRAACLGYRLRYADHLRVSHPTRQSWSSLQRKWRRTTQESYALRGKGTAARLRWVGRALAMPLSAVAHAPRAALAPQLESLTDRRRATSTLFRLRVMRMIWMLRQAAGRGP